MDSSHSSLTVILSWLAYALFTPIIILSWYVLLTFNPHDSYWFYDSSFVAHSLVHPINIIGFLVYFCGGAAACSLVFALTHALFKFSKDEFSLSLCIDYGAGYLFWMIGLSGLSALLGFDPMNAALAGGLFGQQVHVLCSAMMSSGTEQVLFQICMFFGTCFTVGFSWAHYVIIICKPLFYPLKVIIQAMGSFMRVLRFKWPCVRKLSVAEVMQDDDLELVVYTITRNALFEPKI